MNRRLRENCKTLGCFETQQRKVVMWSWRYVNVALAPRLVQRQYRAALVVHFTAKGNTDAPASVSRRDKRICRVAVST